MGMMKKDNLQRIDLTLNQLEHGLRSAYPYIQKAYRGIKEFCPNAHGAYADRWERQGPFRHRADKFFRVTMATLHDSGEWYVYIPTGRNGIVQNYQDVWDGIDSIMVIIAEEQRPHRIIMIDRMKLHEVLDREVPALYAKYPNASCKKSLGQLDKIGVIQKDFIIDIDAKSYTENGYAFPFKELTKFPAWDKYTIPYPPAPKKELVAVVFRGGEIEERIHLGIDEACSAYGLNKMQVKNSLREHTLLLKAETGDYVSFLRKAKHSALLEDAGSRQEWIERRREAIRIGGRKLRSDKGKKHKRAARDFDILKFMIWMQLVERLAKIEDSESQRFPRTA
jgi:hypothetical protein